MGIFYGSDGIDRYDAVFLLFPMILTVFVGVRRLIQIFLIFAMSIAGYIFSIIEYDKTVKIIEHTGILIWDKHHIVGTIEKKLYKTERNQAYRLSIDNFDTISTHSVDIDTVQPKILIEIPENLSINLWDVIAFTGKMQWLYQWKIDGFEKYTFYQWLSWKANVVNFNKIKNVSIGPLEKLSKTLEKHIFEWFPRNVAWIILGMTLWNVELMWSWIKDSFRISGISHILVVSGSNITFLIVFIGGLIRYFPLHKNMRIALIFVFVLIYSTLVGWDVPVMRSTIMWLLWYYAMEQWSKVSSVAILLAVGVWFLIYSPLALVYDPAFGLSFVATMSIVLYYKTLYNYTQRYNIPWWIWGILALSIAASLWTLPITLYHFGETSVWTVFANIAIAWAVWWILFFSVWYMLLWFLWNIFLYIFWYTIYIPVMYIIYIAEFFGSWWVATPSKDIQYLMSIIFLIIFCLRIIRNEKTDDLKDQKKYDPQ
jgi:ComEC/Rec2-related protein